MRNIAWIALLAGVWLAPGCMEDKTVVLPGTEEDAVEGAEPGGMAEPGEGEPEIAALTDEYTYFDPPVEVVKTGGPPETSFDLCLVNQSYTTLAEWRANIPRITAMFRQAATLPDALWAKVNIVAVNTRLGGSWPTLPLQAPRSDNYCFFAGGRMSGGIAYVGTYAPGSTMKCGGFQIGQQSYIMLHEFAHNTGANTSGHGSLYDDLGRKLTWEEAGPRAVRFFTELATAPTLTRAEYLSETKRVRIECRDNSVNESSFRVERSLDRVTWPTRGSIVQTKTNGVQPAAARMFRSAEYSRVLSFEDSAIEGGRTYYYRVAALNAVGKSYSAEATVVTPVDLNAPPTIASPVRASQNPVTGLSVDLSVLGADDQGEANLTYTWSQVEPQASVLFSSNGTNAAKNTIATFPGVGDYRLRVTIRDQAGKSVTGDITLQVVSGTVDPLPAPLANYPLDGHLLDIAGGRNGAWEATFGALDQSGKFYLFDAQDRIRVSNAGAFNFGLGSFSYALRVRFMPDGQWRILVNKELGGVGFSLYTIGNEQPGKIRARIRDQALVGRWRQINAVVGDGTWHHVALVHDRIARQMRSYVDGVLDGTTVLDNGSADNEAPLRIGGLSTLNNNFNGALDDVRFYGVALSDADVAALANQSGQ